MKYFVRVGGQELVVEIDGETVLVDGQPVKVELDAMPNGPLVQLRLDNDRHELAIAGRVDGRWQLVDKGTVHEVEAIDERTRHIRSLSGAGTAQATGGVVKAPMPGLVMRVLVQVGDRISAGQGLVVLEAMKMENELKAPADGVVQGIRATPGAAVEKGSVLVELGSVP